MGRTIVVRTLSALGLAAVLMVGTAREARAQEAPDEQPAELPRDPSWYGWQIGIADATALASVIAFSATASKPPFYGGELTIAAAAALLYGFGGPVVHLAHDSPGGAAFSFGFRLFGTLAGGLLYEKLEPPLLGLFLGTMAASVLDIALVGYEDPPSRKQHARPCATPTVHRTPIAGVPRDTAGRAAPLIGFVGTF